MELHVENEKSVMKSIEYTLKSFVESNMEEIRIDFVRDVQTENSVSMAVTTKIISMKNFYESIIPDTIRGKYSIFQLNLNKKIITLMETIQEGE